MAARITRLGCLGVITLLSVAGPARAAETDLRLVQRRGAAGPEDGAGRC